MVDLDLVEVGSKLEINTTDGEIKCRVDFYAAHNADKGYAILLRATNDTAGGKGDVVDVAIDRKAARLVVNFLQTYFEL